MGAITIDKEFQTLIPPLTEDEYHLLEESILAEGCRDALITWHGVLVDGHNRYKICTEYGIPFDTAETDFESRSAVIEWIIKNQFGRRNLPAYERARLALRLKPIIAERAKERMINPMQNSAQGTTRDELSAAAGVSHDTISRVEKLEAVAGNATKEALRRGEISINAAYQVTKMEPEQQEEIAARIEQGEAPRAVIDEVQKRPHVTNNSGCNEWYTPEKYIRLAREVLDEIDLDPASCEFANETVNARLFYSEEDDGLTKPWRGRVWMNPPYSADLIARFAEKFVREYRNGNITEGIVLVNNATETGWFSELAGAASAVCFPRGRIRYNSQTRESLAPLQGQAFLYFGGGPRKVPASVLRNWVGRGGIWLNAAYIRTRTVAASYYVLTASSMGQSRRRT